MFTTMKKRSTDNDNDKRFTDNDNEKRSTDNENEKCSTDSKNENNGFVLIFPQRSTARWTNEWTNKRPHEQAPARTNERRQN